MENTIILNKLDEETKRWYLSNDESNILSALVIGKEIVTSSYYKTNKDQIVNDLRCKIEDYSNNIDLLKTKFKKDKELLENGYLNKLQREKDKTEDLTKGNINSINIAIDTSMKYANDNINLLTKNNEKLTSELLCLSKIKEEYEEFKCNMNKSKIKGELTESEVKRYIEDNGFITEKPGINSGDLFVYSSTKELICVLEIKNYGENNKHKLGPSGSEVKKMYKDIDIQLSSENKIDVPWLFVSFGCEIPNIIDLRDTHNGITCIYLSEPSYKELLVCINSCIIINKLNNNSGKNEIYIQSKINEIKDIFMRFSKSTPNFKKIKSALNKSIKDLEKEEDKFNKYLEENMGRITSIFKDIEKCPNNIKSIEYDINIDKLSHEDFCAKWYNLVEHCKMLECNKITNN